MKESYIEGKLRDGVKALGGFCIKFTSPGNAGVPDRIILLPDGGVRFVELKTETGRLAPIQRAWIGKLRRLGFDARVLKGIDEVNEYLEELKRR